MSISAVEKNMEKIVSLCKRRGFIFQSSEIYGGLASAWDYGPLGAELKRNVKNAWWKSVVHQRNDMVGLDASILMHPMVWKASGHSDHFADPFVKCPGCQKHFRLDKVWDEIFLTEWWNSLNVVIKDAPDQSVCMNWAKGPGRKLAPGLGIVKNSPAAMTLLNSPDPGWEYLRAHPVDLIKRLASLDGTLKAPCPNCSAILPNEGTPANLMMQTYLGPVLETAEKIFLRPETAQGIFVNFSNVLDATHRRLPFGIAQIGKSFRNEVTPGNYTFRTREFEQMEIEYFTTPQYANEAYERWIEERFQWYLTLGINPLNIRKRVHDQTELAHYAAGCTDIEYNFPFGWSELEGIANRTDFDLKQHAQFSGKDLMYQDPVSNEKFYPFVIEPSGGVDRATLAFIANAYHEETVNEQTRVVLKLHASLAPVKVAVLPLLKKNDGIVSMAKKIKTELQKQLVCVYDDTAAIGKLYRRQDEVGTLFCVTVDVQSLDDGQITVRDRDTMRQERIPAERLQEYLGQRVQ